MSKFNYNKIEASKVCEVKESVIFYDSFKHGIHINNLKCDDDSSSSSSSSSSDKKEEKECYSFQEFSVDGKCVRIDNGLVKAECNKMILESKFNEHRKSLLDKDKVVLVTDKILAAPKDGIFCASTIMSCKVEGGKFGKTSLDSPDDYRGAHSFFQIQDPKTLLTFGFVMTNGLLYARYSLSPLARFANSCIKVNTWEHLIPLSYRNHYCPEKDHVKLDIHYNYKENKVCWYVNDCLMFETCRLGFPLNRRYRVVEYQGGAYHLIRPKQFQIQVGLGSMLDAFVFDDFNRVKHPMATYLKPSSYITPEAGAYDNLEDLSKDGCKEPKGREGCATFKYLMASYMPFIDRVTLEVKEDSCKDMFVIFDKDHNEKLDGLNMCESIMVAKK